MQSTSQSQSSPSSIPQTMVRGEYSLTPALYPIMVKQRVICSFSIFLAALSDLRKVWHTRKLPTEVVFWMWMHLAYNFGQVASAISWGGYGSSKQITYISPLSATLPQGKPKSVLPVEPLSISRSYNSHCAGLKNKDPKKSIHIPEVRMLVVKFSFNQYCVSPKVYIFTDPADVSLALSIPTPPPAATTADTSWVLGTVLSAFSWLVYLIPTIHLWGKVLLLSPRSRCQQGWFPLKPLSLVCIGLPSCCLFIWSFLCVRISLVSPCVSKFPLLIRTPIRLD